MNNPKNKAAYDVIRDEMVRSCRYEFYREIIMSKITEENGEAQTLALDMCILECCAEIKETYKIDAGYIAERISDGASLCGWK